MKRIYITLAILAIMLAASFFWWIKNTRPVNPDDETPKIFVIESGQGVKAIAKNLNDQGLIRDQVAFFLLTKQTGLDSKIQAGSFRLFPNMSAREIAQELTHGTEDIWVTIPEGQRAAEIAEILKEKMPNYQPEWDLELEKNEGYLFPDTYLFPTDSTIDTVITLMTNTFETKYGELDSSKTKLTKEEVVTLASLIEREARHDEDRPKVSSVIHNRLNDGMKLDIDATLQYVLGYQDDQKRWWKKELSNADKEINSPYNTYANAGLPPAPIANPGIESLTAAIMPTNTPYYYYITDGSGINRYGKTLEEHESNIEKYGL